MQVQELGHLVLYVHDIDRSARFYREVLGWQQIGGWGVDGSTLGRAPIAVFSAPSQRTHHELLLIEVGPDAAELPTGRRVGLYHFGLKIGDDDAALVAALERLREHDVPLVGASDHTVTHSLYILDPDGNEIELYVDVPGVDWRADPELLLAATRPLRLG